MDNMLKMMEKYSSRLEEVVAERTSQLAEEKRRTDSLLYRMLPQYVRLCARKRGMLLLMMMMMMMMMMRLD